MIEWMKKVDFDGDERPEIVKDTQENKTYTFKKFNGRPKIQIESESGKTYYVDGSNPRYEYYVKCSSSPSKTNNNNTLLNYFSSSSSPSYSQKTNNNSFSYSPTTNNYSYNNTSIQYNFNFNNNEEDSERIKNLEIENKNLCKTNSWLGEKYSQSLSEKDKKIEQLKMKNKVLNDSIEKLNRLRIAYDDYEDEEDDEDEEDEEDDEEDED